MSKDKEDEERPFCAYCAEYLTPREVSMLCKISPKGLEARRSRRLQPDFEIVGRQVRYRRADVIAWIEKGRVTCKP